MWKPHRCMFIVVAGGDGPTSQFDTGGGVIAANPLPSRLVSSSSWRSFLLTFLP